MGSEGISKVLISCIIYKCHTMSKNIFTVICVLKNLIVLYGTYNEGLAQLCAIIIIIIHNPGTN